MPFDQATIDSALRHLRRRDAVLRSVISAVGPFRLTLGRNRFQMLVRSIVAQQISSSAARSIGRKLDALIGDRAHSAETLAALTPQELRSVGLSSLKAAYLHDLAAKVADGTVRLHRTGRMSDDEVVAELTQVKGIGVWTAQMFLMFSLGRLDVFPHDDFGIRSALQKLYGLSELPDKATAHRIAQPWRPYATVASWYCWRSHEALNLDLPRAAGKRQAGAR